MPEISIVTPSLNSADVLADCIRSVAGQGVPVEHLVMDGNSTDGTLEVIEDSGASVRVLQEPATGIYPALNAGIAASTGAIVGILHADDFYASADVLVRVSAAFEDSEVGACYGDLCYVDRDDPKSIIRHWRAGPFRRGAFRQGWMPPHPTFFLRRSVYERHGLYREDFGTAADYELMLRMLLRHKVQAAYIPGVLVHMRTGGASNHSLQARWRANRMDREAWRANGLRPYPWTTLAKPLRKVGQWWRRP
jgi:glycosyltransferase